MDTSKQELAAVEAAVSYRLTGEAAFRELLNKRYGPLGQQIFETAYLGVVYQLDRHIAQSGALAPNCMQSVVLAPQGYRCSIGVALGTEEKENSLSALERRGISPASPLLADMFPALMLIHDRVASMECFALEARRVFMCDMQSYASKKGYTVPTELIPV
jgi:hypothetical protein